MSGSVPESTIEEIRARTDLSDLISSYGIQVKRAGSSYKACCPFHHEKTPSFNIQPDKGYYHCFGCGESGDIFTFVMKQEGLSFIEAVRKLAAGCGVVIEEKEDPEAGLRKRLYALHAELAAFYRRCLLQSKEAAAARAYLAARDLNEEIGDRFSIGYAPLRAQAMLTWASKYGFKTEEMEAAGVLLPPKYAGRGWFNRFGGRLMFTIRDRAGRAVAFSGRVLDKAQSPAKYVNSPETLIFKKSNILFAFDQAASEIVRAPRREAIVCEGQIDVIRCHACGFKTAVASQGTAFTAEHVKILKKCADSVVLVFDGDAAGQKASVRTGGEFLAADVPVRVATLPEGEDPDSLLRTKGPAAFQACLDASESITGFQVRTLRAKETTPDSIDAVARVSRAALGLIANCPSAVIRANLMEEAAKRLHLPVTALEEDFEKAKEAAARENSFRAVKPSAPPAAEVSDDPTVSHGDAEIPFSDEPDERPFESRDAAAPAVNPPSTLETAFCEFLFDHERDTALAAVLAPLAPEEVFAHEFTKKFVSAWLKTVEDDSDEIASLQTALPPEAGPWLDTILLSTDRAAFSELQPEEILQDFLRRIWTTAIRRLQGSLPAESTAENDAARLRYSALIPRYQRGSWEQAARQMSVNVFRT